MANEGYRTINNKVMESKDLQWTVVMILKNGKREFLAYSKEKIDRELGITIYKLFYAWQRLNYSRILENDHSRTNNQTKKRMASLQIR